MRATAFIPLLFLAGCGGGGEADNAARPTADSLAAGQWELTSEIITANMPDELRSRLKAAVGSRATETVCVGSDRPPSDFFSGPGYECASDNFYLRGGRMNVTLRCSREGLPDSAYAVAEGRFESESAEFERSVRSGAGEDEVHIAARVTGRRTGDCPAGGEEGNQSGNQAG